MKRTRVSDDPTGVGPYSGDVPTFDLSALHESIESARLDRGLSRAAVARSVGVAASTIARFAQADPVRTEADGIVATVRWLGVVPEQFVRPVSGVSGVVLDPAVAMVRVDATALGLRTGQRTSIAVLVQAAHARGVPIAALTRGAER